MPSKSWRDSAREIIASALLEHEAQKLCLDEPINLKEFKARLTKIYPWQRTGWAYQAWLKERKLAVQFFGLMQQGLFTARQYGQWSASQLGKVDQSKMQRNMEEIGQMRLM